jgi:alcohol dehydrogenase
MTRLDQPLEMLRPPIVRFGANEMRSLGDWLSARGYRRVFVISDAFNGSRLDALHVGDVAAFCDTRPEPSTADLEAALAGARAADPDVIIGFGGGSPMDLAKLISVMLHSDKALEEIKGLDRTPERKVGLVQIPTTSGTGSEVGTRALVTDPVTRSKVATESRQMLADLVILDPELTASLPPAITAAVGVDAMAHCVEAFTSRRAHPIVDAYAVQGIELVGRYLPQAVRDGRDANARAGMALAAFYGGVCLGPVNTTAGHALAYPLGTRYNIPHGVANSLIFPHVLAFNSVAAPDKTARICAALGIDAANEGAIRRGAIRFCRTIGLEDSLSGFGVSRDDLPIMAQEAHAIRRLLDHNPRDISPAQILEIYEAAY